MENPPINKNEEIKREPFKMQGHTFNNKEELFQYLDKNAVDEEGNLSRSFFDYKEDIWPEPETISAVNEWTDNFKKMKKENPDS
jgi:hypothetical protein